MNCHVKVRVDSFCNHKRERLFFFNFYSIIEVSKSNWNRVVGGRANKHCLYCIQLIEHVRAIVRGREKLSPAHIHIAAHVTDQFTRHVRILHQGTLVTYIIQASPALQKTFKQQHQHQERNTSVPGCSSRSLSKIYHDDFFFFSFLCLFFLLIYRSSVPCIGSRHLEADSANEGRRDYRYRKTALL